MLLINVIILISDHLHSCLADFYPREWRSCMVCSTRSKSPVGIFVVLTALWLDTLCFSSGEPHRSSTQSCLTMKCFEPTIKHWEKSGEYPSEDHITNEAAAISLCYHVLGGAPDEQLEKLFLCCQVIFLIRSPDVDDSLVRLPVNGDVPHLRTSGFDCREQQSQVNKEMPKQSSQEDNRASGVKLERK